VIDRESSRVAIPFDQRSNILWLLRAGSPKWKDGSKHNRACRHFLLCLFGMSLRFPYRAISPIRLYIDKTGALDKQDFVHMQVGI